MLEEPIYYVEYRFLRGCPSFSPLFVGTPFTQWHEVLSQNTRDSRLNQKSLSHLGSDWYRVETDTKTPRQNYRS